MNRGPASYVVALVALIASNAWLPTASAGYVTDGSLTDWGFASGTGTSAVKDRNYDTPSYGSAFINQTTPTDPLTKHSKMFAGSSTNWFNYVMEDSNDSWDVSHTLGPNRGGQDYDSEFMGIGRYGDQVVISILTGQRADNVLADFAPGDIKLTTTKGVYGVEVGGGIGGASSSAVTTLGGLGSTYQTASDGYTIGALNSDGSKWVDTSNGNSTTALKNATSYNGLGASSQQTAGSIWFSPTWLKDPIPTPTTDVQIEYGTGTYKGQASSYIYKQVAGTQHAVIEVSIPISMFQGATITQIEWSPSCGNDILAIKSLKVTTNPEPASLVLMGFGGLATCVIGARRRRGKAPQTTG